MKISTLLPPSRLAAALLPALCCLHLGGFATAEEIAITLPGGKVVSVDQAALTAFLDGQKTRQAEVQAVKAAAAVDEHKAPPTIELFDFTAGHRYKFREQMYGASVEKIKLNELAAPHSPFEPLREAFRLRQTWDAAKLFHYNSEIDRWEEAPTTGAASDGAEFGWTRNRMTDSDTWNAKGVAYMPILMKANERQHFLLLPSIEFNRDSTTDGTPDEINSLVARLGVDFNYVGIADDGGFSGMVYRAAVGYQTDFDFASGQWIFELQTEPVDEKQGIGVYALRPQGDAALEHEFLRIPGTRRRLSLAPIFSLADISDVGDKESLKKLEDNFATVGFKVSLDYEIEALKHFPVLSGLKVGAEYRWWTTLGSKSESYDYLEARITAPFLGSSDKLMLKAFYRSGDTPDTLEQVDTMGLALTAKF